MQHTGERSAAASTITAAHVRLCMLRGTKIATGHTTSRYYYKGLCVVTQQLTDAASEHALTAFWTPQGLKGQQTFEAMLRRNPRKPSHQASLRKKATVTLLMLRKPCASPK
jgi:hypothetical protein